MKKIFSLACFLFSAITSFAQIDGAWKLSGNGTVEVTCIVADNYFMQTTYDKTNKLFLNTMGGTINLGNDGKMNVTIEFNTADSTRIGQSYSLDYKLNNNELIISVNDADNKWQRIDDGKGGLSGNWRITEREQNGKMNPIRPGPRKTLKILSGTRFQWAAINTETKEFFGTGGGAYSFSNGKYTENIEFFSRDNSRVGASLSFDGKVDGNKWHHSGKSSKGDPIAEIWTRQN
ncbi:membrane or secreted protein [Pseudoflavitalea rhizosphaerae]|uniref:membrane or secreted protein n=1 Tax=Pseudoflavitalea rhizosphaerae TaxID=1884793 RepID=UPI000F8E8129|nr:membrane or secreted protein [Pseudoflavitalea rhizosphaerae]